MSVSYPSGLLAVKGDWTPPYSKTILPENESKNTYFLAFLGLFLAAKVSV